MWCFIYLHIYLYLYFNFCVLTTKPNFFSNFSVDEKHFGLAPMATCDHWHECSSVTRAQSIVLCCCTNNTKCQNVRACVHVCSLCLPPFWLHIEYCTASVSKCYFNAIWTFLHHGDLEIWSFIWPCWHRRVVDRICTFHLSSPSTFPHQCTKYIRM